jgi:phosphatidylserine decarboxylase
MKFHKEGYATLLIALLISLGLLSLAYFVLDQVMFAKPIAILLSAFVLIVVLQFFRNPSRLMLIMNDGLIAPADGKVVVIEEVTDQEYFKKPVRQISIFMSPTNVHINWYPLSGEVIYSKYHKGKYLVAWDPKSSTDNERHSVVVRHPEHGEILIKQIAGAVARRIVNYAKVGEQVEQGEELGFIKFGSRVDLLIPLEVSVDVVLEQISSGGQTIIGTFKK